MPTDHEAGLSDDLKRAADEANLRFSQGMNPLLSQQFFADGFPDTLCHYTDFGGLHGILQTGTISATYTQTLNDGSEQEYGLKMVQRLHRAIPEQQRDAHLSGVDGSGSAEKFRVLFLFCETGGPQLLRKPGDEFVEPEVVHPARDRKRYRVPAPSICAILSPGRPQQVRSFANSFGSCYLAISGANSTLALVGGRLQGRNMLSAYSPKPLA
jgi:hypothetical protein